QYRTGGVDHVDTPSRGARPLARDAQQPGDGRKVGAHSHGSGADDEEDQQVHQRLELEVAIASLEDGQVAAAEEVFGAQHQHAAHGDHQLQIADQHEEIPAAVELSAYQDAAESDARQEAGQHHRE